MFLTLLKRNLTFFHNFSACIIGTILWYSISGQRTVRLQERVPLAFISHEAQLISAPEDISLTLEGPRSEIYLIEREQLALHIDTTEWKPGTYQITPESSLLFLPKAIHVISYQPSHLTITIRDALV